MTTMAMGFSVHLMKTGNLSGVTHHDTSILD